MIIYVTYVTYLINFDNSSIKSFYTCGVTICYDVLHVASFRSAVLLFQERALNLELLGLPGRCGTLLAGLRTGLLTAVLTAWLLSVTCCFFGRHIGARP